MPHDCPPPHGEFIEDPTDEDYAAAARAALSAKNHPLALEQAAAAASLRPLHEPHVRLLDEAIAATKGPLQALELKAGGTFFGMVAARGRALARLNRTGEALDCLFQAATFAPTTPFVLWGVPWVAHAREARKVDARQLALRIVELVQAGASPQNLAAAEAIAEKVQAAASSEEGALRVARSRIFRALGRPDEALTLLEGRRDWASIVERGAVHRDRHDLGERVRCFEEASEVRPDEVATLLDLGDAYLDDARLADASRVYERVLSIEPPQAWARASLAYTRFLASGERMTAGDDDRSRALAADADAYVTRLSDPIDGVVRVLRSVARAPAQPSQPRIRVRVRAERPLAPSARLAFDMILARLGKEGALDVTREGNAPERPGPLWRMEAGGYVLAAARPDEAVMASVAAIASTPFGWDAWKSAAALAGPEGIDELVAAMAYVPAPPDDRDVARHVHAFQTAAALRVAMGPFPADVRLEVLLRLADGVDDWSAAASWIALRALAEATPELRPAVEARARTALPVAGEPLAPMSRALAVTGCELAAGDDRAPYLRLRARVRREIAQE